MKFQEYVKSNQTVMQFVKDAMPGENDKYTGTLDYATARFNTILLRLSEDPLKADRYSNDLQECFHAIQSFYEYTLRLNTWPVIMKPITKLILHYKGTFQIPKIKILLEKINN